MDRGHDYRLVQLVTSVVDGRDLGADRDPPGRQRQGPGRYPIVAVVCGRAAERQLDRLIPREPGTRPRAYRNRGHAAALRDAVGVDTQRQDRRVVVVDDGDGLRGETDAVVDRGHDHRLARVVDAVPHRHDENRDCGVAGRQRHGRRPDRDIVDVPGGGTREVQHDLLVRREGRALERRHRHRGRASVLRNPVVAYAQRQRRGIVVVDDGDGLGADVRAVVTRGCDHRLVVVVDGVAKRHDVNGDRGVAGRERHCRRPDGDVVDVQGGRAGKVELDRLVGRKGGAPGRAHRHAGRASVLRNPVAAYAQRQRRGGSVVIEDPDGPGAEVRGYVGNDVPLLHVDDDGLGWLGDFVVDQREGERLLHVVSVEVELVPRVPGLFVVHLLGGRSRQREVYDGIECEHGGAGVPKCQRQRAILALSQLHGAERDIKAWRVVVVDDDGRRADADAVVAGGYDHRFVVVVEAVLHGRYRRRDRGPAGHQGQGLGRDRIVPDLLGPARENQPDRLVRCKRGAVARAYRYRGHAAVLGDPRGTDAQQESRAGSPIVGFFGTGHGGADRIGATIAVERVVVFRHVAG